MGKEATKLEKANDYAVKAETWWSLIEKVWENRAAIGWSIGAASFIASAIYNVFGFINDLGWAGWVLALIPAILITGGVFSIIDWIMHLRRMRKLREATITPPSQPAVNPAPGGMAPIYDDAELRAKVSDADQRLASLSGQQDALSRSLSASSETEQLLGKIFLFEKRLPLFDKELQTIESEWAAFDRHAKLVNADPRKSKASPTNLLEAVKSAERRLFGMGIKIKLYDHSRFNADPHGYGGPLREVPDDLKPSYRKASDLQDHAITRLKAHKAKLIREVDEAKSKIESVYTANKSPEDWGLYEE